MTGTEISKKLQLKQKNADARITKDKVQQAWGRNLSISCVFCLFINPIGGEKFMKNIELRTYALNHGVKLWEIAEKLGVSESTFSKRLRKEFDEEKKEKIMEIIDELSIVKGV